MVANFRNPPAAILIGQNGMLHRWYEVWISAMQVKGNEKAKSLGVGGIIRDLSNLIQRKSALFVEYKKIFIGADYPRFSVTVVKFEVISLERDFVTIEDVLRSQKVVSIKCVHAL